MTFTRISFAICALAAWFAGWPDLHVVYVQAALNTYTDADRGLTVTDTGV